MDEFNYLFGFSQNSIQGSIHYPFKCCMFNGCTGSSRQKTKILVDGHYCTQGKWERDSCFDRVNQRDSDFRKNRSTTGIWVLYCAVVA